MLPLEDRRILVTRAVAQASDLATRLEALGAEVIQIPAIEIVHPLSYFTLDSALTRLADFDWVVFTSANAVQAFASRGRGLGVEMRPRRIAVIGPATATAVYRAGLAEYVDLMPQRYVAEGLIEDLLPLAAGQHVLLVRAAIARETLPDALREAGCDVTIAEAYRNIVPPRSVHRLQALFRDEPPDAITLTSSSTAQKLADLLEAAELKLPEGIVLASIGPITSRTMREVGMTPTLEAKDATIPTLVEALRAHFANGTHT